MTIPPYKGLAALSIVTMNVNESTLICTEPGLFLCGQAENSDTFYEFFFMTFTADWKKNHVDE
jgi:hypothetical protein